MTAAQLSLAAAALLTLAGLFGARGKHLELASHFRVQHLLAARTAPTPGPVPRAGLEGPGAWSYHLC